MVAQPTTAAKMSISRIAFAVTGAAIVLLSAVWIALPFLVFEGGKWPTPAEWFLTPAPYAGLLYVGIGLFLIRCSR